MKFNRKQMVLLFCDMILIQIALFLSFTLRFEGHLPVDFWTIYGPLILPITIIKVTTFTFNNVYKKVWRYANIYELVAIIQGVSISTILFIGYVFFFRVSFPRSIILLDWMLTLILIGGLRFTLRLIKEYKSPIFTRKNEKKTKVLIVGAGDAGEMVLREYLKKKDQNVEIIGFIDDDPAKIKLEVHGVRVLGDRQQIKNIMDTHNINEVIIAMPSASGKEIREFNNLCSKPNVNVRILPSMYEIINGDVQLNQIREVQVEDLLGREPIRVDMNEIAAYLTEKTVLITGGGGSIGSELCRQVAKFKPKQLLIFDICENNVYEIEMEMRNKFSYLTIIPLIGSIRDMSRLRQVFQKYRPEVVFHAAAHKHVPMMEYNPEEAIKNNIFGTRNVALISDEFSVDRFVMISTDKAVNPTNIMGATKRVAEMIIEDINKRSKTKFVAVRFGNVLGSRGSVIPLFKKQIAEGGPVTITHPEITRYFMTIPEASQLVIQAAAFGNGGEVFVLDMGKPVKIIDLAKDLIELSGLKVGEDIEIKYVGLRPGEKLYEELLTDQEGSFATKHERILVAKLDEIDSNLLQESLKQMNQILNSPRPHYLVGVLAKLVATFQPGSIHINEVSQFEQAK